MAITIEKQPRRYSVSGIGQFYVISSSNVIEEGFRYKIVLTDESATVLATFFMAPNINNGAVINIRPIIEPLSAHKTLNGQIHKFASSSSVFNEDRSYIIVTATFSEWWLVDGVLTENSGSELAADSCVFVIGYFDNKSNFSPDTAGTNTDYAFNLNSNVKRWFSDRKYDTHIWDRGASFGVTPSTQTIYIPCFENDYGVLSLCNSGTEFFTTNLVDKVQITIYSSTGAPSSYTQTIGGTGEPLAIVGCYPANLNASTVSGIVKPSDYPNWRFYTVRALDSSNNSVSALYIFYNASLYGQSDCKYDRIRIAWANSRGGWDYFNFIKRNEESLNIERKSFTKVRGNYGTYNDSEDNFYYNADEAGRTTIAVTAKKSITVNSDWISENEFIFLQSLLVSNTIHWVQDDGTFFPVQIEATDYTLSRERNGKLKNVSFKFTMANDYI